MAEPRRRGRSVRLRVTAGATAVFAIAFALAAVLLVNRVKSSLEGEVRRQSGDTLVYFTQGLEKGADPSTLEATNPNPGVGVLLMDRDGNPIPAGVVAGRASGPAGSAAPFDVVPPGVGGGEKVLMYSQATTPQGPVTVTAVGPLESVRQSIDALTRFLALGTPLLILAVGALIWFFVGRALRPVDAMCTEVDEITHSTLHRRVAPAGTNDEMDRLAHTMNDMLDRLELAADRQKQFVSDASHELKTPLTTIRTSVEVGLRDPSSADWEAIASRVLAADVQMEALVTDLLDLARLDEMQRSGATEDVDLEELVLASVSRRPNGAAGPEIDVSAVVAGRVQGDRRSLDRLSGNLIANAIVHADRQVRVGLDRADRTVVLTVEDDGPGIPPDERTKVFDRFARLDESRTSATSTGGTNGTGLGLAIVRSVVDRHHGTITIDDSSLGGARFTVTLPAAGVGDESSGSRPATTT